MKNINRRKWLQLAGLSGAATVINPIKGNTLTSNSSFPAISNYDYAKLDSNENPFGPSQNVRNAIIKAFDTGCRYPRSLVNGLAAKIAEKEGVTRDHIVVTGGSTEGLKAAGKTFGHAGDEIISADPVYRSLIAYAEHNGAYINTVPINKEMNHDLEEMERRISYNTSLVFVCNPNNPTGTILPKKELEDFCRTVEERTVVFSDEAYYDYIDEAAYPSMVTMVKEGLNVIVSRTFSKVYGLAGLRIGYLVARPDIAKRVRSNVMAGTNVLAVAGATAAMNEESFYKFSISKNEEGRKLIYSILDDIGLPYMKSNTNFVFFESGKEINGLRADMRSKGVAVGRPFPPLNNWCRISTGKLDDIQKFGEALKSIYS